MKLKKAWKGILVAGMILLLIEGILWLTALISGNDLRQSPLPKHPEYQVICQLGNMQKLCPDQGPHYERVRPEVFFHEPTQKRIITIGESFVFGLGLQPQDSWPKQLAEELKIQVLNFARCGTYASRLVPILKAAIDLKPDAIILATGNNEHTMTSFFRGPLGRNPLLTYKTLSFFSHFQSYGLLSRMLIGTSNKAVESFDEASIQLNDPVDQLVYAARRRPPKLENFPNKIASRRVTMILEEEQRLKERIFAQHLQFMIDTTTDANIPLFLSTLPRQAYIPPALSGVHTKDEKKVIDFLQKNQHRPEIVNGLKIDNKVAIFHYEKSIQLRRKNKAKESIKSYEDSNSWDLVPDATPEINQIIRDLAAKNQIPLIDLHQRAWEFASRPTDFFLDSVHVNAKGGEHITKWVAEKIREHNPEILEPTP